VGGHSADSPTAFRPCCSRGMQHAFWDVCFGYRGCLPVLWLTTLRGERGKESARILHNVLAHRKCGSDGGFLGVSQSLFSWPEGERRGTLAGRDKLASGGDETAN
jgi:hypothetical protein